MLLKLSLSHVLGGLGAERRAVLALMPTPGIIQLQNGAWRGGKVERLPWVGKQQRGQTVSRSVPGQPVGWVCNWLSLNSQITICWMAELCVFANGNKKECTSDAIAMAFHC